MKRAGRTNRTLVPALISAQPESLPLKFTEKDSAKVHFEVTSVSPQQTDGGIPVLGYKSSKITPETELHSEANIQLTL